MTDQYVCELSELGEVAVREATIRSGASLKGIFVVRKDDRIQAYENSCPHTGAPLNWLPGRFLDEESRHIMCATHAARFTIADGLCFSGPCKGEQLKPVEIKIRGGSVFVPSSG